MKIRHSMTLRHSVPVEESCETGHERETLASCRFISCKRALQLVALLRKMTCNLRDRARERDF